MATNTSLEASAQYSLGSSPQRYKHKPLKAYLVLVLLAVSQLVFFWYSLPGESFSLQAILLQATQFYAEGGSFTAYLSNPTAAILALYLVLLGLFSLEAAQQQMSVFVFEPESVIIGYWGFQLVLLVLGVYLIQKVFLSKIKPLTCLWLLCLGLAGMQSLHQYHLYVLFVLWLLKGHQETYAWMRKPHFQILAMHFLLTSVGGNNLILLSSVAVCFAFLEPYFQDYPKHWRWVQLGYVLMLMLAVNWLSRDLQFHPNSIDKKGLHEKTQGQALMVVSAKSLNLFASNATTSERSTKAGSSDAESSQDYASLRAYYQGEKFDSILVLEPLSSYGLVEAYLRHQYHFVLTDHGDLKNNAFLAPFKTDWEDGDFQLFRIDSLRLADTVPQPTDTDDKLINATILLHNGMEDKALVYFKESLDASVFRPASLEFIAQIFHKKADYEKAVKCYSYLIAKDKKNLDYYEKRAASYMELEDYSSASSDFTLLINAKRHKPEIYFQRGICYMHLNRNFQFIVNDFKLAHKLGHQYASNYLKMIGVK